MENVLDFWFRLANLPYSILVCCMLFYWLTVMLGVVHLESLDIDFEFDSGAEGILDTLQFLNIGRVPFSIWLSVLVSSAWGMSTIGNAVLDAVAPFVSDIIRLPAGAFLIFPAALAATKFVTNPMKSFFQQEKAVSARDFVGQQCTITSSEVSSAYGTAEIRTEGAPVIINCRNDLGDGLTRGQTAVIYEYDEAKNIYHVTKAA